MIIPKQVKIGGINHQVVLTEHTQNDVLGTYDFDMSIISIRADQSEEQKRATLVHEIIEGINFIYAINLKHHQIELLETALNALEVKFYFDKKNK
jgi:hypothetical protein